MTTSISTKPAPHDTAAGAKPGSAGGKSTGEHEAPTPRYEVRGTLGAGGLGVVLEALDTETRRVVARGTSAGMCPYV